MKRVRNYKLNQQLCIVVNVFKDRTQSSWIKERAPTKHPITEIWAMEFIMILQKQYEQ